MGGGLSNYYDKFFFHVGVDEVSQHLIRIRVGDNEKMPATSNQKYSGKYREF